MENQKSTLSDVQGTDEENMKSNPSSSEVEVWVKRDLATAIAFLNAIHTDPDLVTVISQFIAGRIANASSQVKPLTVEK